LVALAKGMKLALIFVGVGIAAVVGITTALFQQDEIQQTEVTYDNPLMNSLFLQS
jgi:hypothetical protein